LVEKRDEYTSKLHPGPDKQTRVFVRLLVPLAKTVPPPSLLLLIDQVMVRGVSPGKTTSPKEMLPMVDAEPSPNESLTVNPNDDPISHARIFPLTGPLV